jgi:hypothetical protein
MAMRGFFASLYDMDFKNLIAERVIRILYWLIVMVISITAVLALLRALFDEGLVGIVLTFILTPLIYLVELIFTRVALEVLIVVFRMADDVKAIRIGGTAQPQAAWAAAGPAAPQWAPGTYGPTAPAYGPETYGPTAPAYGPETYGPTAPAYGPETYGPTAPADGPETYGPTAQAYGPATQPESQTQTDPQPQPQPLAPDHPPTTAYDQPTEAIPYAPGPGEAGSARQSPPQPGEGDPPFDEDDPPWIT